MSHLWTLHLSNMRVEKVKQDPESTISISNNTVRQTNRCVCICLCRGVFVHEFMYGCLHLYVYLYVCVWACEKGGLGGRSEKTELLHWDMSLCLPLSPRTGTATCPNCKGDERIKELKFGCDCNEEKSALAASIFGAFWITLHTSRYS